MASQESALDSTQQLLETPLPEVRVTKDFDALADSVFDKKSAEERSKLQKQSDDFPNRFEQWRAAPSSYNTESMGSDKDENLSPNAYFESPVPEGDAACAVDDVFLADMEGLCVYATSPNVDTEERKKRVQRQQKKDESCSSGFAVASPADSVSSMNASQWFDNTNDEIILYEKFGVDYKDVVDAMSLDEKKKLKQDIRHHVPTKTLEELEAEAERQQETLNEVVTEGSVDVVCEVQEKFEVVSVSPTPKPRTRTPSKTKKFSPRSVTHPETLKMLEDDLILALGGTLENDDNNNAELEAEETENVVEKMECQKSPASSIKESSPSGSSKKLSTMAQVSPFEVSPEQRNDRFLKGLRTPDIPSYLRPTAASKRRASPRKDPRTQKVREASICCKYVPPKDEIDALQRKMTMRAPSSIYGRKIISPVAQYIHERPVALRSFKGQVKKGPRQLIDALGKTSVSDANSNVPEKEQKATSLKISELPEKQYESPKVAVEVREQASPLSIRNKNSPQVVRHVGRAKVPSIVVNGRKKDNDEEAEDENSVEMSLHAVKDIQVTK